jgi:NAD(P)-dependent dehydrogenase (short-subunit alcohol dehydrogenase family)
VRSGRPVCLLTGAGGLLGSAFARRFADSYDIIAVWHRQRPVAPTHDQDLVDPLDPERDLAVNGYPVYPVKADLSDPRQLKRVVNRALEQFGDIDVVVNAAVFCHWAPILAGGRLLETMDRAFAVNVGVPLALSATLAQRSWAEHVDENLARNRCVVNVSSTAGLYVYPGGQSVYSATKAALNILTCHLADEFEPIGVRVNALAPDAFPSRVPLATVLDGVERLIVGNTTGRILALEPEGESWI